MSTHVVTPPTSIPVPASVPGMASNHYEAGWTREELVAVASAQAAPAGPDYHMKDLKSVVLPFIRHGDSMSYLAIGVTGIIHSPPGSPGGGTTHHVVVAKVRNPDGEAPSYHFWCGDRYLQGTVSSTEARKRSGQVTSGLDLRAATTITTEMHTSLSLRKGFPATEDSSHFWTSFRENPMEMGCTHVRHFFHEVATTTPEGVSGLLEKIDQAYSGLLKGKRPDSPEFVQALPVAPRIGTAQAVLESAVRQWGSLSREILDVAGPQILDKQPVRILGVAGYGKTYGARRLGRSGLWEDFFEHGIYPDHEASDMLGGPRPVALPRPDGTFDRQWIHQDSEPIKAFRAAAAGRQVFLLLDEIGNARRDVLNVLKNLLNPDEGIYRIQTGRAVSVSGGVAQTEIIEAPVKNITIVATSNVGGEYEANTGDPAVNNRFYQIYLPIDHDDVLRMIALRLKDKGFNRDAGIQMNRFYGYMRKLLQDGTIERIPNPRDLGKVIAVSADEKHLPKMLCRFGNQWVGQEQDGGPNADQLALVYTAVKNAFSITDASWDWKP